MQEIERKFLVSSFPEGVADWDPIQQGYLCETADAEVRIRHRASRYWLTCKHGQGLVRDEWEVEITAKQFAALWPATSSARIVKRRGQIVLDGLLVEVDVFGEALEGLLLAEVEFPTSEAAARFDPPAWLGREVTGDGRYANRSLARSGAPGE